MDGAHAVEEYYRAIDAGEYDALAAVLAPEFVHRRPDRTIKGRESFVAFMHEERPRTDTTHTIDARFVATEDGDSDNRASDGDNGDAGSEDADVVSDDTRDDTREIAVAGRLRGDDGESLFSFVDRHEVAAGSIGTITTYTR